MKRELKGCEGSGGRADIGDCKAHPDEKGTESSATLAATATVPSEIARPIPMKRELKDRI